MKQAVQDARTGEITVANVPIPQVLPGCVLVQVAASLISAGTERAASEFARKSLVQKAQARPDLVRDVMIKARRDGVLSALGTVRARLDQPLSLGYSSAGTVLAVAPEITDLRPGDRVACAGAGFAVHAEIACVPRLLVAKIPDGAEVSFEEAAFTTVGAVALHGIRNAEVKLGDVVAVIGLGLLGQLTVGLLKAAGARVVGFDIEALRAGLARKNGADAATPSRQEFHDLCFQYSRGLGADSVLITAQTDSSDPVNLAANVARDRAIVVAVGTVGLNIERKHYYEKELEVRVSRSYGPGRYDIAYEQKGRDYPAGYIRWTETRNMEAFLQFVAEGKLDVASLISCRLPVDRAVKAFQLIRQSSRESLGVVLTYEPSDVASSRFEIVRSRPEAPRSDAKQSSVSVGLIGAGNFVVSTLLPAINRVPGTEKVGICTATGLRSWYIGNKFGFRYCTTADEDILRDPNINTVVIATRHHLHARQVVAALAASKHVFCEKPLCLNEKELAEIVRTYIPHCEPSQRVMVGFNRRFSPMLARVKSFFAEIHESIAMHYRVNAGFLPADHWIQDPEQGGGRILGEVCHFIDLLLYLGGSEVVRVQAQGLGNAGQYSKDNIVISLEFKNGSHGTISYLANGDRSFGKERLEVFGGGATAVMDDFRRMELIRGGRREVHRWLWRQDKGHRAEWCAFFRSIREGKQSPISFREIVASTLITMQVNTSLSSFHAVDVDVEKFLDSALRDRT